EQVRDPLPIAAGLLHEGAQGDPLRGGGEPGEVNLVELEEPSEAASMRGQPELPMPIGQEELGEVPRSVGAEQHPREQGCPGTTRRDGRYTGARASEKPGARAREGQE